MKTLSNEKIAMSVSVNTIVLNVVLSVFKFVAGILAHSGAMISDAIHSASDVFSTFIVMIGVKMAGKASDKEHPYGHERLECVAAILLAVVLAIAGIGIGYDGVQKIISGSYEGLEIPGVLALIAAAVSILVKEGMYWYTRAAAKKIHSGALMADAWHHRSDALSSVGSLVGIGAARLGLPVFDPIASVVICLFIVKAAYSIFMDSVNKMTDMACDEETEEEIRGVALAQQGVEGVDMLRTRLFGDRVYVEMDICADGTMALQDAHHIAEATHDAIEKGFPRVKHCMVHVNPTHSQEDTEK